MKFKDVLKEGTRFKNFRNKLASKIETRERKEAIQDLKRQTETLSGIVTSYSNNDIFQLMCRPYWNLENISCPNHETLFKILKRRAKTDPKARKLLPRAEKIVKEEQKEKEKEKKEGIYK